jgi:maltooligosyltrehalose trehalohydrolase
MGEEYNEPAPFLYFIDFEESNVVDGVRNGRKDEFADFLDGDEPPDPQSHSTFFRSKLNFALHEQKHHRTLWLFYQQLIHLRKNIPALRHLSKHDMQVSVDESEHVMTVRRWHGDSQAISIYNFHTEAVALSLPAGSWDLSIDSSAQTWTKEQSEAASEAKVLTENPPSSLPPKSFVLFTTGSVNES